MKIKFLGSAQEVGRSCILLNKKYLLDCGIKVGAQETAYPFEIDQKEIKAVFLSHAHLDHTGALPLFNHYGLKCPIYSTKMTKLLARILLKDSLNVEVATGGNPQYGKEDINRILSYFSIINFNRVYKAGGAAFTILDAGHIPGSGSFIIETDGKRLLYTGDINSLTTKLMHGLNYKPANIDVMICESTYGDRDHPQREKTEEMFLEAVEETLRKGGKVLVPSFAVGRAQEMLMVLNKRTESLNFRSKKTYNTPLYLDGMAKNVTDILLRSKTVRDIAALRDALKKVQYVADYSMREGIAKKQGIFVTTSGMLDGGPALDYIKHLHDDEKNSILLTGYQVEGSNGRTLVDKGYAYVDGIRIAPLAKIMKFDFSAHSGQKELVQLIKRIKPQHLILNHGNRGVADELAKKVAFIENIHIPVNGESLIV